MSNHVLSIIPAPHLDNLINRAKNDTTDLDTKSNELVFKLFKKLQVVEACGDDERRELWFAVERGSVEDFGDYEDYLEDGEVENRDEFNELWLAYYPDSVKWYRLVSLVHSNDKYRTIFVDGKQVIEIDERYEDDDGEKEDYTVDRSELLNCLLSAVDNCIESLRAGTYNNFVSENLPHKKRVGKIRGEDFWHIFPESKDDYLKNITPDEVKLFTELIKEQTKDSPNERLPEMTAAKFFDCCRLGYEANNYDGVGEMTSKELYYRHADGRDEGLKNVVEDSVEDFVQWFHDKNRYGGHPWEVCRGGNSTHISLYVDVDERGWWLSLAGSSWGRSVETVKFYLALVKCNIPIYLLHGKEIAAMLTGQDWIGIVPEGVLPRYCDSYFPDEKKILQFMNLPEEKTEDFIAATEWYSVDEVRLAK